MNPTRNGKIARLPSEIREQLNRRLLNGESGTPLVEWLNSRPEVQTVMAEEFGGKAVRQQNLSQWKRGGYNEWLRLQEAQEMLKRIFADGDELIGAAQGAPADKMAAWVTARYLTVAKPLTNRAGEDEQAWKRLRELCHDVVALQRGDLQVQRLEFEREKVRAGLATQAALARI